MVRLDFDNTVSFCPIGTIPEKLQPNKINHNYGGRGIYFEDRNGHYLEVICSLFARFRTTTTRGLRIPAARIRRDTFAYPDGAEPINDSQ